MMKTKTLKKKFETKLGQVGAASVMKVPNARGGSAFSIDQQQREHVGRPP